ncbi:hypothetical protein ScPMuIL_004700 [Solemya velum]
MGILDYCRCPILFTFLLLMCIQIYASRTRRCREPYDQFPMEDISHEDRLIKHLLKRYQRRGGVYGRPVHNHSDIVTVYFGMQLIQIMDLDEKKQVLSLNVWTHYEWKDEFLSWNATHYDGITTVRLGADNIWRPDIKLYNYADTRLREQRDALAVIESTGSVTWIPQAVYKSSCDMDVTTFPFDKQKCKLKFGSWTYTGLKMNLDFWDGKNEIIIDDYVRSNQWDLLAGPAIRNEIKYTCCPETFIDLTFSLVLRRKATFYNYILVLPCVLLTSLTLVLFWIPPESPAKMQLGMNVFMAFFVLLLLFEGNLPPAASSVPILGTYYCLNMILITLSSFLNVFVVNLSFYGARAQVPFILKKVMFNFFAKLLCMENLVRPFLDETQLPCPPSGMRYVGVNGDNKWVQDWKGSSEMLFAIKKDSPEHSNQLAQIDSKVSEIRSCVRLYKERMLEKDRKEKIAKEWKASEIEHVILEAKSEDHSVSNNAHGSGVRHILGNYQNPVLRMRGNYFRRDYRGAPELSRCIIVDAPCAHVPHPGYVACQNSSPLYYVSVHCIMDQPTVSWISPLYHGSVHCDMDQSTVLWISPLYYGPVHCIMDQSTVSWVSPLYQESVHCIMGQSTVSWISPLYHGSVHCIMGQSTVSWISSLYHGSVHCIMDQSTVSRISSLYHGSVHCIMDQSIVSWIYSSIPPYQCASVRIKFSPVDHKAVLITMPSSCSNKKYSSISSENVP